MPGQRGSLEVMLPAEGWQEVSMALSRSCRDRLENWKFRAARDALSKPDDTNHVTLDDMRLITALADSFGNVGWFSGGQADIISGAVSWLLRAGDDEERYVIRPWRHVRRGDIVFLLGSRCLITASPFQDSNDTGYLRVPLDFKSASSNTIVSPRYAEDALVPVLVYGSSSHGK